MTHEGGRDKLDDPWREGLNNLDFGQSFLKFLKPDFFYVLGTFNFWVKGGQTILYRQYFWIGNKYAV